MTAGATPTAKQAYLQTFANELIEDIAGFVPSDDLDSLRSLRLVCRNVNPVATEIYAQRRFKQLHLVPTRSKIETATNFFANRTFGESVKVVTLKFHGHHRLIGVVHSIESGVKLFRTQTESSSHRQRGKTMLEVAEADLIEYDARSQAAHSEDCDVVDVSRMLSLFPNMSSLVLKKLNGANLQAKLPWIPLTTATTPAVTKVDTLEFKECDITSEDIRHFLSIFHAVRSLVITSDYFTANTWAAILCNIIAHGISLRSLFVNAMNTQKVRFLPEQTGEETSRDFQKKFRTFQSYKIMPASVDASGGLAIKYACERIVRNVVGDDAFEEMMRKCEKEAEFAVTSLEDSASV